MVFKSQNRAYSRDSSGRLELSRETSLEELPGKDDVTQWSFAYVWLARNVICSKKSFIFFQSRSNNSYKLLLVYDDIYSLNETKAGFKA